MPTLRFRGLSLPLLRGVAKELSPTLAQVVGCPADWFNYENVASAFVSHEGKELAQRPPVFIDLIWFSRGQEVQDKLAETVTEAVQRALRAEAKEGEALDVDVTVIAHAVEKNDYYENGAHF